MLKFNRNDNTVSTTKNDHSVLTTENGQRKSNAKDQKERWKINDLKQRKGEEETLQTSKRRRVDQSENEIMVSNLTPGRSNCQEKEKSTQCSSTQLGGCVKKPECGPTELTKICQKLHQNQIGVLPLAQLALGLDYDKNKEIRVCPN